MWSIWRYITSFIWSYEDETDGGPTKASIDTKQGGVEEIVEEEIVPEDDLTLEAINMTIDDELGTKDIANYCLSLLRIRFCGQTSVDDEGHVRVI